MYKQTNIWPFLWHTFLICRMRSFSSSIVIMLLAFLINGSQESNEEDDKLICVSGFCLPKSYKKLESPPGRYLRYYTKLILKIPLNFGIFSFIQYTHTHVLTVQTTTLMHLFSIAPKQTQNRNMKFLKIWMKIPISFSDITEVNIKLTVIDVLSVNDRDFAISLNTYLSIQWTEPRLIFEGNNSTVGKRQPVEPQFIK